MADRVFHDEKTQGIKHVTYNATLSVAGAAAAVFVEGDTPASATGSYLTSTKGTTGKYILKTKDKFLGCVKAQGGLAMTTPTGNNYVQTKKPVQNSDSTWTVELWHYTNAAGTFSLADVTTGDYLTLDLTMRDSQVKP